jgi:heat-inducible transcriptional repressor
MSEKLGERRAAILRAIVREYVRSGEPVGSKHLVDRSKLDLSPATVRNEMARLEELGYLTHPHTSAGRVPTDAGYRFTVDEITSIKPLPAGQRRALEFELGETVVDVEDLLRRAGEAVAKLTHQVSAIASIRAKVAGVGLRRLELFGMGARAVRVVLIAENGHLEQRVVALNAEIDDASLDQLSDRLGKELQGVALDEAASALRQAATDSETIERQLLEGIAAGIDALSDSDSEVFVGGAANLAREVTFERETLQRLFEALERQTMIVELLSAQLDESSPLVRIGTELSPSEFDRCSVVVAGFTTPDGGRGTIGIIGPTRMEYERMMATAAEAAKLLGQRLGES